MNRAEDWLEQAHRDLAAARDSASAGYHVWAAFQARQCAEKAAKAVMVQSLHGSVRGHSVTHILSHLPASPQAPTTVLDSARELDKIYLAQSALWLSSFDQSRNARSYAGVWGLGPKHTICFCEEYAAGARNPRRIGPGNPSSTPWLQGGSEATKSVVS